MKHLGPVSMQGGATVAPGLRDELSREGCRVGEQHALDDRARGWRRLGSLGCRSRGVPSGGRGRRRSRVTEATGQVQQQRKMVWMQLHLHSIAKTMKICYNANWDPGRLRLSRPTLLNKHDYHSRSSTQESSCVQLPHAEHLLLQTSRNQTSRNEHNVLCPDWEGFCVVTVREQPAEDQG